MLGKLNSNMRKNQTEPLFHTVHKIKFKIELSVRHETIKLLKENLGNMAFNIGVSNTFLGYVSQSKRNKRKNKKAGIYQTESILHS